MSMLREGLAALRSVQSVAFAETVEYRTPGGGNVAVRAVPGRTVYSQRNERGLFVRVETRDFIVAAPALPTEPATGDTVVFDGRVYEVVAPGGEPCWRWSDALSTAYRIHTKLVGEETS